VSSFVHESMLEVTLLCMSVDSISVQPSIPAFGGMLGIWYLEVSFGNHILTPQIFINMHGNVRTVRSPHHVGAAEVFSARDRGCNNSWPLDASSAFWFLRAGHMPTCSFTGVKRAAI